MSEVAASYGGAYDFPRWHGPPAKTLMLATIPRSGSTYVASEIWRSGVLGAPMEYLNLRNMEGVISADFAGDLCAYWADVKSRRTSPTGVFSYKMFVQFYDAVAAKSHEVLRDVAPDHVVYLQRRDTAAQVVSYAKAMQTGAWFAEAKGAGDTDLATAEFPMAARLLLEQRRAWADIFSRTETTPLLVWYEDVLEDRQREIDRIVRFVGLTTTSRLGGTRAPSVTRHGSDTHTAHEWKARAAEALEALRDAYEDVADPAEPYRL